MKHWTINIFFADVATQESRECVSTSFVYIVIEDKFSNKTDALNFLAMKVWFLINPPIPTTIQVESL
jgi:hypothetical protein